MKNWKKGMIAGSIICIAAGFLFIGIGSSMGGWKNIDQINSRYIHFGGSDTFIGLNLPENTKESIEIFSRETDSPADAGNDSTGEVISFNGKSPEKMEISANTLALKIVPGESDAIILSGSNRDKMNCYIEDNCLYLEEKNHKPLQKSGEIVLTVPESMDWKKIEIDAQAAYVALQDFSAEEMEFSADAGSIEASGLQMKKLIFAYLKEKHANRFLQICALTYRTFSNFLTGQCLEAVILGMMFFVSMTILRFPFAVLVGVLIAFTALIPIFGAFIGCVVGAFLILTISPSQAAAFIVLFIVLQQIEGNLIYPHVVGSSVGLPGIWVLVAVTIGGNLFGIMGMLTFIPISSVCYALLRTYVNRKVEEKEIDKGKFKG